METKVKVEKECKSMRKDNPSRYIPASVKQELFKRAQGCCELVGKDGVRCQSRYKLQVDH